MKRTIDRILLRRAYEKAVQENPDVYKRQGLDGIFGKAVAIPFTPVPASSMPLTGKRPLLSLVTTMWMA